MAMTRQIKNTTLDLLQGDIVVIAADAIVNAANSGLAGGGGVDGAIHRAGGPSIMEACRLIGGCPTGSAVATTAGRLPARYIYHAVGPVYHGHPQDAYLLAGAYQACLKLAEEQKITSISFPSLSTGAYGYPVTEAAPIAMNTVVKHLQNTESGLKRVTFVLYDTKTLQAYEKALANL